jgi:hypothetical protein
VFFYCSLRLSLLSGEEGSLGRGAGARKGKGAGGRNGKGRNRPANMEKMSAQDLANLKRHRLWTFIVKKVWTIALNMEIDFQSLFGAPVYSCRYKI